jgi:hypothetical protein
MDCRCSRQLSIYPKNLDLSSVSTLLNLTEIEFRNHSSWESKLTGNGLHLNLGPTAKPNNIGILKYQFENWISLKAFLADIV